MKVSRVFVIHPEDPTTGFLNEIIIFLQNEFIEKVVIISPPIEAGAEYIEYTLQEASISENDFILFLGHGRSDALYGVPNTDSTKTVVISLEDAERIFSGKNVVLFSCNSNQLCTRIGSDMKSYVGFGNMPTDWNEIMAERDIGEYNYLSGLTEASLDKFKSILINMMIKISAKFLSTSNFSREAYLTLRMELNKALIEITSDKTIPLEERIELFKIVQRTKNEIAYKD